MSLFPYNRTLRYSSYKRRKSPQAVTILKATACGLLSCSGQSPYYYRIVNSVFLIVSAVVSRVFIV